jgi:hypothetical protein
LPPIFRAVGEQRDGEIGIALFDAFRRQESLFHIAVMRGGNVDDPAAGHGATAFAANGARRGLAHARRPHKLTNTFIEALPQTDAAPKSWTGRGHFASGRLLPPPEQKTRTSGLHVYTKLGIPVILWTFAGSSP